MKVQRTLLEVVAGTILVTGCSGSDDPPRTSAPASPAPSLPGVSRPPAEPPSLRPRPPCFSNPKLCDDRNPCTTDVCLPVFGCSNRQKPDGTLCNDGQECTAGDACSQGVCAGQPISCDDDNVCTEDSCVAGTCSNVPIPQGPCDDNDACTTELCSDQGQCAIDAVPTEDDNECTSDSCDAVTGVAHDPVATGVPCTSEAGVCDGQGACVVPPESESVVERVGGQDPAVVRRRVGLGRHPVAASDEGFAVAFMEELHDGSARVGVAAFSPGGTGRGLWRSAPAPFDADPVIATVPGGFVVAYADLGNPDSDGDGLDVRLTHLDLLAQTIGSPLIAHGETLFGQHSPDVFWDGAELVVGWEDDGMASSWERRVCSRTFSSGVAPTGAATCESSAANQSEIVLAATSQGLAKAWREETLDGVWLELRYAGHAWSVQLAGYPPTGESAAMAELDASHLLMVYTDGWGDQMMVVADSAGGMTEPVLLGAERYEPSVAVTQDGVYLSWRERLGLDDVLVRKASWDGFELSWPGDAMEIPYPDTMCGGDQDRASLVSEAFLPTGALVAIWNDMNTGQVPHGDVLVSVMPTPIVRTLAE